MLNFFSNTSWQVNILSAKRGGPGTVFSASSKMNAAGTALRAPISITGFTPNSSRPTYYTTNTQGLVPGEIIAFDWNAFPVGNRMISLIGHRVTDVVPNVSFRCVQFPIGVSPAVSQAATAFLVGITGSTSDTLGPDGGWSKDQTLLWFVDDHAVNACPAALQVIGLRKGINGPERFKWTMLAEQIGHVRGRNMAAGGPAFMKIQGSASTGRFYIDDGVAVAYGPSITGSAYINPVPEYGGYEHSFVQKRVSMAATKYEAGFELDGLAGDLIYLAIPTTKPGTTLSIDECGQRDQEDLLIMRHSAPPLFDPLGPGSFPVPPIVPGGTIYGYPFFDLAAISFLQFHHSVISVDNKIEWVSDNPGMICFVGTFTGELTPDVPLVHALQEVTVNTGKMAVGGMSRMFLSRGSVGYGSPPGCFGIFTNNSGGTFTALQFDVGNARLCC